MKYPRIIYDFSDQSPISINIFVFIVIFFVIMFLIGFVIFEIKNLKNIKNTAFNLIGFQEKFSKIYSIAFKSALIMVLTYIFIVLLQPNYKNYNKIKNIYKNKQYKIIEGKIENYDPKNNSGRRGIGKEKFRVGDIGFKFSGSYGYQDETSTLIWNGLIVRISYIEEDYDNDDNIILKLEAKKE